jgi:hypothetical protein
MRALSLHCYLAHENAKAEGWITDDEYLQFKDFASLSPTKHHVRPLPMQASSGHTTQTTPPPAASIVHAQIINQYPQTYSTPQTYQHAQPNLAQRSSQLQAVYLQAQQLAEQTREKKRKIG